MAVLGSTSLTGCNSIPDFIASGSLVLFQQTSAPINWTKQTTHDNKALRVVTGTATPGGSTAFTAVFASRTPAGTVTVTGGTVNQHTLAAGEIPAHSHPGGGSAAGYILTTPTAQFPITGQNVIQPPAAFPQAPSNPITPPIHNTFQPSSTGQNSPANGQHSHPFTAGSASFSGAAQDFAVQYVDVIICSKD
jgi:hypothetical protein